ncbi:MAG TPA: YidC/Oxa1 family membrane protein insertase [Candidatus Dormibacteraeota bacterium]|nr:YidC/Oxa1 family membrane protein insertase [Candidatus Dormibacteraeota bacterium]
MLLAGSPFDIFMPINQLWKAVFLDSLTWLLNFIYVHIAGVPAIAWVGAYGVAIIVITLMIRALLAPLLQFQLVTSRRAMVEQRKLAPQVAELRKKYRKDAQRLQQEQMKLYQEHGINPLGQFVGCLPMVLQMPVLIALYYVFTNFSKSAHVALHFLFIPNLNVNPLQVPMFTLFGFNIPAVAYLVFPLLAALTTYVQSKMMQMPPPPNPTEQELQTMQMQRTMVLMSPLMIGFFALNVPAGLGLYWFVGNLVSIIQQSFVVGWGSLFGKGKLPAAATISPPSGKLSANGQRGGANALPPSTKKQKGKAETRRKESEGT